jgi:predicted Zn-dependent protease
MKKLGLTLALIAAIIVACKTVPLTGRKGLKLIPSSEINTMSFQQYGELKSNSKLSTNKMQVDMVQRSGVNIQKAAEKFLQEKGLSDALKGYEWEFILIDDPTVNAFCMPGGKVAFYTGIMPYCQDEAGVAVVMGHEIAHAIAEHGNERMSQGLMQQMGGMALSVALAQEPAQTQMLFMQAFGVGSQVGVMLPFSRKHESEADEIGLYFMAMAGYDPRVAPDFWRRMSSAGGGQKPPELLSTHPSDQTRINNLNKWMPKAMEYYNASNKK